MLDCQTNKPVFAVDCNENKYGIVQDIAVLPTGNVWIALSTGVYSMDFRQKKINCDCKSANAKRFQTKSYQQKQDCNQLS